MGDRHEKKLKFVTVRFNKTLKKIKKITGRKLFYLHGLKASDLEIEGNTALMA